MVNEDLVKLIGNRILSGGINPKTGQVFKIEDILNAEYKQAVEDYILINSNVI